MQKRYNNWTQQKDKKKQSGNQNTQKTTEGNNTQKTKTIATETKEAGRPEVADDKKSAKTIANKESMG